MTQEKISNENALYWNELCGSPLAESLGVTDASKASLKKFDDWYFDIYPYLFKHIPFNELKDRKVLEIGLGYGTVSQLLAESCVAYTGFDIAAGPVSMVNHRLRQNGLSGQAIQGSILKPEFQSESFDTIVAIGCLHHTGNLRKAIDECWKLLRPGGSLVFMVYYAYSYRRFRMAPSTTLRNLGKELFGYRDVVGSSTDRERAAYDAGSDGVGAPHTDWISARSLRGLCNKFSSFNANTENINQEFPFKSKTRMELLKTRWPSLMGLDLYATAMK